MAAGSPAGRIHGGDGEAGSLLRQTGSLAARHSTSRRKQRSGRGAEPAAAPSDTMPRRRRQKQAARKNTPASTFSGKPWGANGWQRVSTERKGQSARCRAVGERRGQALGKAPQCRGCFCSIQRKGINGLSPAPEAITLAGAVAERARAHTRSEQSRAALGTEKTPSDEAGTLCLRARPEVAWATQPPTGCQCGEWVWMPVLRRR